MQQTPPCPTVDKALVAHLVGVFPGRIPSKEVTLQEVGVLRGEQRVLEYLQRVYSEQNPESNVLKQTQDPR